MAKNKEKSTGIKLSKEDKVFDIVSTIILGLAALVILYPLYFVVIASVSDPTLVNTGQITFYPRGMNFDGYIRILEDSAIWKAYGITAINTVVGTAFNIVLTMPLAYAMSRKAYAGKNFITAFVMFTMFFNGGLIPTYLLVDDLGLYNTPITLIILNGVVVYNVIIAKSTIQQTIPEELYEATTIDGCGHLTFFFRFVIPLSKAVIAVLILYYGVAHWNQYMNALIYVNDTDLYPLQLVLRNILIQGELMAQNTDTIEEAMKLQTEGELIKYVLIVV